MRKTQPILVAGLLLALITLTCYWQVFSHDFIYYDDQQYLTKNQHVTPGLSWSAVLWAFSTGYACNWHPLTWISHMIDCELFGLNPGWHHLMNVLFHVANSVLLLVLLFQMTGATWRSVFVAALFALHPLHIESVAWASERKDVLSTLFWILTMMAYVRYVRKPSKPAYGMTLVLFTLGLMAKPMLVTLPFVLLLTDVWPLGRVRLPWLQSVEPAEAGPALASAPDQTPAKSAGWLVCEKIPFFALAFASSIVTFIVQKTGGAVSSLEGIPIAARIANAFVAYVRYIGKSIWPVNLAPIYPYDRHLPILLVGLSALVMVALTVRFAMQLRRQPYLLVNWFWYLGTLVPTIGLVQVGSQSMADRYMYIPSIGLFVLIVWGLHSVIGESEYRRQALAALGVASLIACVAVTSVQLRYWRNSETLFRHTLAVTRDKHLAHTHLGKAVEEAGRTDEAFAHYLESIRLVPTYAEGNYNVGTLLMKRGQLEQAMPYLQTALKSNPKYPDAYNNLGSVHFKLGHLAEAKQNFSKAIQYRSTDAEPHYNLATVLLLEGKGDQAAAEFTEALRLNPNYAAAHANLGVVFANRGDREQAIYHFSEAARLNPRNFDAQFNLGFALLEQGKNDAAAQRFAQALKLAPDSPKVHYHLALAMAREQNRTEAVVHAEKARSLALAAGQKELAAKAEQLLEQK